MTGLSKIEKKREAARQWYQLNKNRVKEAARKWKQNNPIRAKENEEKWKHANPERVRASKRKWAQENPEATHRWAKTHPEEANKSKAKWRKRNPKYQRDYFRNRYRTDIEYRIAVSLRRRLGMAVRKNQKNGSAVRDLGISIADFRSYISALFKPGMTWDNWGKIWHLDHIKPLAAFDLKERDQFLEACRYTNLQPMFVRDNLIKGKRI